jgi:hypothetical protein
MDEQKRVVVTRRRRSREEAARLVAEFEASGLSQVRFCQSRGLSRETLSRYRKRLRGAGGETVGSSRWVAVEVSGLGSGASDGSGSGLALAVSGGRRIEVGRGFDPSTLVQLLSVLERC